MKKLMTFVCGAALALAANADCACGGGCKCGAAQGQPPAKCACGAAECAKPPAPPKCERGAERQARPPVPPRNTLVITDSTTPEQIEAFKKELCAKIDAAAEAYKAKPADENGKKKPMLISLRVSGERPAMRGRGPQDGRGPREGKGPREGRGRRNPHKGPRNPAGDLPQPPPEA